MRSRQSWKIPQSGVRHGRIRSAPPFVVSFYPVPVLLLEQSLGRLNGIDFAGWMWDYNARGGWCAIWRYVQLSFQCLDSLGMSYLSVHSTFCFYCRVSAPFNTRGSFIDFSPQCSKGTIDKEWWCLPSSVVFVPRHLLPRYPKRFNQAPLPLLCTVVITRQIVVSWRRLVPSLLRVLSVGSCLMR